MIANPDEEERERVRGPAVVAQEVVAPAARPVEGLRGAARALRVVFVVCPSYQGATLLALLLNNHSLISALGDMLPLSDPEQLCACGQLVAVCAFWRRVADRLGVARPSELRTRLPACSWPLAHRQYEGGVVRLFGNARVNRALGHIARTAVDLTVPALWRAHSRPPAELARSYRSFYELVVEEHGTSVFVDGHKSWRKAALLAQQLQPEVDVRIVHLLRDPRGFAESTRRHDGATDLRASGWLWRDLHERMAGLESLAPYHMLRYEDLCARPKEELARLFDFIGVEPEDVSTPPKDPRKHHVLGNRMLHVFDGGITNDERWRETLTPAEQHTILRAAGGFARRYGYPAPAAA